MVSGGYDLRKIDDVDAVSVVAAAVDDADDGALYNEK